MKFIHTADLHLGYKYSSEYSNDTLEILYSNQKKVLSNIIDLGNDKKIDALFIAGDLFDTPKVSEELFSFVKKEFERATFKVFIICGNHDPKTADGVFSENYFSENVFVFPGEITMVEFMGADIYGFSFTSPHKLDNSLYNFMPKNPEKLNIFLSHGDILKESYYNPMSTEDIEKSGIDYLALGHIHLKNDIDKINTTYYGYSGTPQGSTFKETGETFVILGDIEKGFLKYEKIPVCEHTFRELDIILNAPENEEEIISAIRGRISSYNISKTLFNITLKGFIADGIELDCKKLEDALSHELLYIKIKSEVRKKYNIELLKTEDSIRGEFVRNTLRELSGEDEEYILKVIEYGVGLL